MVSMKCFPPEIPTPKVCSPADAPTAHTSCVIELYEGAPAEGGALLIFELDVLLVVEELELPDS